MSPVSAAARRPSNNFKKLQALGTALDPVFGMPRTKIRSTHRSLMLDVAYANHARAVDNPPKLIPVLMGLQANSLVWINSHYFDCRFFI